MKYFEDLGASNSEPIYTKVWGNIVSETSTTTQEVESAFGEPAVRTFKNTNKEWIITGTAKVPYDFGDESVLTIAELTKASQDREVYLADIKKKAEEYKTGEFSETVSVRVGCSLDGTWEYDSTRCEYNIVSAEMNLKYNKGIPDYGNVEIIFKTHEWGGTYFGWGTATYKYIGEFKNNSITGKGKLFTYNEFNDKILVEKGGILWISLMVL